MKKQFPLLSKIYLCEFLSAMFFWLAGWLMFTPAWSPEIAKYLLLGTMMAALFVLVIAFFFTPSEKIDDRAKENLNNSAFFVLALLFVALFAASILLIVFGQMEIKAYHLLFVLAIALSIHAITFYVYEKRGK